MDFQSSWGHECQDFSLGAFDLTTLQDNSRILFRSSGIHYHLALSATLMTAGAEVGQGYASAWGRQPLPLAFLLAEGFEKDSVARHAVIVNVLLIRHILDLGGATDTERALWALFHEVYFNLVPRQAWLAEAIVEKLFRDVAVLLADFHVQPRGLAMNHAGLSEYLATAEQQHQAPHTHR